MCGEQLVISGLGVFLLVLAVIFISILIRSTFGFGNALIAMPLLVLLIGVKAASPLVALTGSVTSILMLIQGWQDLQWKETLVLLAASLPGIPLGLFLLNSVPESTVKSFLGLLLIGFGLYNLLDIRLPSLSHEWLAVPFGLLAGILGGAYNTNGPPIVIYAVFRGWNKDQFRASLQGFFLISSLLIIAGHGITGLWTRETTFQFLGSIPLIGLAVCLGDKFSTRFPQEIFNKAVYYFLILAGGLMFL
ncbi:MAG: sulfite exporter TauE/SafE family protein [Chloroflexi bacterium]|nr:MAG: sulfite exporter TauE/SafE family protein [Chloroflexota bacterium]